MSFFVPVMSQDIGDCIRTSATQRTLVVVVVADVGTQDRRGALVATIAPDNR